jgi:phosphoglycerate dehydrogenase-like enzyme
METVKLLLISRLDAPFQAVLQDEFPQLRIVDCHRERERVAEEIRDAEIVYGRVKPEEFARAERLKFIQHSAQGVESFFFPELVTSGVQLANAKGIWTVPVAEHVLALILGLFRKLPQAVEKQRLAQWGLDNGNPRVLRGATVGCLGTGSIGRRVAELCRAFGALPIGCSRTGRDHPLFEAVYGVDKLRGFLGSCDVVVNSLPVTPDTIKLVNAQALAWMRPDALFINVGRGGTVDEAALIETLQAGRLGGAGLDVFEEEPLPPDSPLWGLPNVLITPHIAGNREGWQEAVFELLRENLRRYFAGEPLLNLVDKEAGY